jgi:hypothetical protein
MTNQGLFSLFLFLHVLAAIVAFGPALASGLIGAAGGREPQHANFATRLTHMLQTRLVIPVGLTLPITGALMILIAQIDLSARANWWLGLAIVLYAIAITYSIFVQAPAVAKLAEMTTGGAPPGGGGPPAAGGTPQGPGAPAPTAAAPSAGGPPGAEAAIGIAPVRPGPPPHIRAQIKRIQRGGMFLGAMIVVIVLLMVVKPQF